MWQPGQLGICRPVGSMLAFVMGAYLRAFERGVV
jgi:hypothetical protein